MFDLVCFCLIFFHFEFVLVVESANVVSANDDSNTKITDPIFAETNEFLGHFIWAFFYEIFIMLVVFIDTKCCVNSFISKNSIYYKCCLQTLKCKGFKKVNWFCSFFQKFFICCIEMKQNKNKKMKNNNSNSNGIKNNKSNSITNGSSGNPSIGIEKQSTQHSA